MRVVALISGGKDSCYNMMQCVAEGHMIVALANLRPKVKDELDSYMYQTVGHQAIDLYAEAMGLPLYRRTIDGACLELGSQYQLTAGDEVEDLFQLLKQVQCAEVVNAVSVGAILSDYQRVRVENVCSRLGLSVLAYLWRRDQLELLQEMIDCHLEAVIIKVAALGLDPTKHLGKSLQDIYAHMIEMSNKYGLNVCGEGGEYETFTLDCPLFRKRIVIDESEVVLHSDDAFAPVAYLNLTKLHLEEKQQFSVGLNDSAMIEAIKDLSMKRSSDICKELSITSDGHTSILACPLDQYLSDLSTDLTTLELCHTAGPIEHTPSKITDKGTRAIYISGIVGCYSDDVLQQYTHDDRAVSSDSRLLTDVIVHAAMTRLTAALTKFNVTIQHLVAVHLYVSNMADFASINSIYKLYFGVNPPIRLCVQTCLGHDIALQLDCIAYNTDQHPQIEKHTMHVQSISHWAPANIGPYSQAIQVNEAVFVAGQIGLVPGSMTLVEGGAVTQCKLALRHCSQILLAMKGSSKLHDIVLAVCYVTRRVVILDVRRVWQQALRQSSDGASNLATSPLSLYVIVESLPRQADVEWHVVARWTSAVDVSDTNEDTYLPERKSLFRRWSGLHYVVFGQSLLCPAQHKDHPTFSFTIAVEDDTTCPVLKISSDMLRLVLNCMKALLSDNDLTYLNLSCLRFFHRADCLPTDGDLLTNIEDGFHELFECDKDKVCPIVFIPVVGFESENCVLIISHV